jgi:hypothetical protein
MLGALGATPAGGTWHPATRATSASAPPAATTTASAGVSNRKYVGSADASITK